eukprot:6460702-Amphidinium_carterae.1
MAVVVQRPSFKSFKPQYLAEIDVLVASGFGKLRQCSVEVHLSVRQPCRGALDAVMNGFALLLTCVGNIVQLLLPVHPR